MSFQLFAPSKFCIAESTSQVFLVVWWVVFLFGWWVVFFVCFIIIFIFLPRDW